MIQKLIFTVGAALIPTSFLFAQSPMVISNKGDKIAIADLKLEPWNQASTRLQATTNSQNIYQNGNVGIGDYTSSSPSSNLEIKGNNTSQLGFINSANNSKFDISKELGSLTITARIPGNNRILNLYDDGTLYLGQSLLTGNKAHADPKFIFDGTNGRLSLNLSENSATEDLDIKGNARIRTLNNANQQADYTRTLVARNDGTLGYTTLEMPVAIGDPNTPDIIPSRISITVNAASNEVKKLPLVFRAFEITRKSLVFINYSISVANVIKANTKDLNAGITDGRVRLIGSYAEWSTANGAIIPRGFEDDQKMMYDALPYSNTGPSGMISTFRLNSSKPVILEPGKYRLYLNVTVSSPNADLGTQATFGNEPGDDFSIITMPIQ